MNDGEFEKWDVITFIGQDKKWVVREVMTSYYDLLELPIGQWPSCTTYAKGFCHWNAVKVGEWDNLMRREVEDAEDD